MKLPIMEYFSKGLKVVRSWREHHLGGNLIFILSRNTTTGGLTKLEPEVNIFRILCGKPILKFTKQLTSYLKFLKFIGFLTCVYTCATMEVSSVRGTPSSS